MAIYSLEIYRDGYTEDVYYFCHSSCLANVVKDITGITPLVNEGGTYQDEGTRYSWGVSDDETDSDMFCKGCGDFIQHGLECDCEDKSVEREPLTETHMKTL